jgi:hypothetical protein
MESIHMSRQARVLDALHMAEEAEKTAKKEEQRLVSSRYEV